MQFPVDWQRVNKDTDRLFVKGGWLVRVYSMKILKVFNSGDCEIRGEIAAVCFLPDPEHEWGVKS